MKANNELKIFLADDDPFCLGLYEQHLHSTGYTNTKTFTNGSTCLLELINNPGVIFFDYGMDTLNGIEVLKKIKRFNPDIYVVFLSGQETIETAVTSLKYGAFDYIVKGSQDTENITRVLNKIQQVMELLEENKPGFFKKLISLF